MTEYELAQALFRQQQAPDASMPTTSQVRGVAASDSSDGTVTVVLDATAGGASAEMEVPTAGGITEGGEVLVTLLDGVPVEVTQAGSIDDAVGTATKYITETINGGIRVHPGGDTANYIEIDADGMGVVVDGTNVAHFGETALPSIQHGSVDPTTSVPAMGYHDFDVTFPRAFSTTPDVQLTIYATTSATASFDCDIYLCAKSATGFTARIVNRENATRSLGFTWLAVG